MSHDDAHDSSGEMFDGDPASTGPLCDGRSVGEYVLLGLIGKGGMGEVWRARHVSTNRPVAIKFLFAAEATVGSGAAPDEFRLVAGLRDHPNVVRVHANGVLEVEARLRSYFVMDLVAGARTLTAYADHHRLDWRERIDLFLVVCDAIAHVHRHGFLHLDIKPSNLLVDEEGAVRVTDFGVARPLWGWLGAPVCGTPGFMGPEHSDAAAELIDERADVWSLSAVLFRLLAGRLPYVIPDSASMRELSTLTRREPPALDQVDPSLKERVPIALSGLDQVVRRGLAPSLGDRWSSVNDLANAVRDAVAEPSIPEAMRELVTATGASVTRVHHRRPRLVTGLLVIVITVSSIFLGAGITAGVLSLWPAPVAWLARSLPTPLESITTAHELPDVVVVAFDTATANAVVGKEGLADFRPTNRSSYRRMHAEVIPRLVEAGVKVIVFDVFFESPRPDDEALAAAIRDAQEQGVSVVLAVKFFDLDPDGAPVISPVIYQSGPKWGAVRLGVLAGGEKMIPAVLERDEDTVLPSLSATAFAAFHEPDCHHEFAIVDGTIEARYFTSPPGRPGDRRYRVERARTVPTDVRRDVHGITSVRSDDLVAAVLVTLPAQEVLDAATVRYEQLWDVEPFDLRGRLGDRIAFIVDFEKDNRVDDTDVPMGCLLATATQVMLSRSAPRWARHGSDVMLVLAGIGGTLAGLLIGQRGAAGRSRRKRAVLVTTLLLGVVPAIIAILLSATWLVYWAESLRLYPVPAAVAAACGAVMAAIVFAMRPPSPARHSIVGVDSDPPTPSTLQET